MVFGGRMSVGGVVVCAVGVTVKFRLLCAGLLSLCTQVLCDLLRRSRFIV